MQNHLSRHKETCDSLMHADYCVIKFSQHARCFTSFLPALHFPLLRNKQLKAWDHQYSLHEYSSFPTPVFDACSASTSSTFTMRYKPVQQVNERNDIVTSSTKTTYYQSKLSLIHTSMGTSKRSWSVEECIPPTLPSSCWIAPQVQRCFRCQLRGHIDLYGIEQRNIT